MRVWAGSLRAGFLLHAQNVSFDQGLADFGWVWVWFHPCNQLVRFLAESVSIFILMSFGLDIARLRY